MPQEDIMSYSHTILTIQYLKGTVSVISRAPLCKDGKAQFSIVPLKALSDQL